jgi:hypothetical protein
MLFGSGGVPATITGLQEYNNYIHGNMGFCYDTTNHLTHATAFIFNDLNSQVTWVSPLIFNNLLVNSDPSCGPANGLIVTVSNSGPGAGIYNNTLVGSGTGIAVTGTQIVKNNIFSGLDDGVVNLNGTIGAEDFNVLYNLLGRTNGAVMVDHNNGGFWSTVAGWIANTPWDHTSQTGLTSPSHRLPRFTTERT